VTSKITSLFICSLLEMYDS